MIDQRTYAPFHQHFIVARLDLDIDGEANTVYAAESEPLPIGPDNPHGLALTQRTRRCDPSARASRTTTGSASATWKVRQRRRRERPRHPGRLQARAGRRIPALIDPDSPVLRRARAIEHTLWVTPYSRGRALAVRRVPQPERRGLRAARWTARDRPIEDTDVVLWYVFGIHHVTRPRTGR